MEADHAVRRGRVVRGMCCVQQGQARCEVVRERGANRASRDIRIAKEGSGTTMPYATRSLLGHLDLEWSERVVSLVAQRA